VSFDWPPSDDYMVDTAEPCFGVDLPVRVFGVDDDDHAFSQTVHTRNISEHSAALAGLEERLKAGDTIGIHFGDKTARCKVTWVVDSGDVHKIDVGVRLVEGQPHPWQREVQAERDKGKTSTLTNYCDSSGLTVGGRGTAGRRAPPDRSQRTSGHIAHIADHLPRVVLVPHVDKSPGEIDDNLAIAA
jgi:hypothetical protein